MTGFPGETDAEFEETRRMVEELPFTYLHVFTYSPRPGTPATAMRNQVPVSVARERNRILRDLAVDKKLRFMRSFVGKTVGAITLQSSPALSSRAGLVDLPANQSGAVEGPVVFTEALTDNYLKLRLAGQHEANRWIQARVEDVVCGAIIGVLS
jgi:threonylcarbamoyladenosine tRNA methylthiotransferase MtaB